MMSDSVTKFKRLSARLRGTAAKEIPAPFALNCECGCRLTGVRNSSWQQCTCPDCRAAVYLLPSNVYPSTGSVVNDVIGGTPGHRLRVVASELVSGWRGDPATKPSASDSGVRSKDDSTDTDDPGTRKASARRRQPKISLPRASPVDVARRTFTPFRLLVTAMLLVVGTTGILVYQGRQLEAARRAWRESKDSVVTLLTRGDFDSLQETLSEATAAGRQIGQEGSEWRVILNLDQETRALASVCSATLTSLLSDASARQPLNEYDLGQLKSDLMGGTFVVDGHIDPVTGSSGTYVLDIPAMFGHQSISVMLQLEQFDEYLDRNESRRCLFAFRLSGIAPPPDHRDVWQLDVDSESFVLLTSEQHCEHLGFSVKSDPAVADILTRQREFVEKSVNWAARGTQLAGQRATNELDGQR